MKHVRPFDHYREIFRQSNIDSIELLKFVFEKSDKISLWIIGLSIGGISIFANNISSIQSAISSNALRQILLLLAISATSGIVFRGLYLYFFVILNKIAKNLEIAFSNNYVMESESSLSGNESFEELIEKLNIGFGDDLSFLISIYNNSNEKEKNELYNSIVDYYTRSVKFAKDDINNFVEIAAETYSKFYGINKEKYVKKFKSDNLGYQYKLNLILVTIFYFIYILSFFAALFTFVFSS